MNNNFDMEEFYDFHDLGIKFTSYNGITVIRLTLNLHEKEIGRCELYNIENIGLTEEDLFCFFDEIEGVAVDNFCDIASKKPNILKKLKSHRFVYLTNMYINPKYRNKGVGSVFIEDIENLLRFMNIRDIYLVSAMYEDNKTPYRNDSFYLKNNFKIINDSGDKHDGKMMYKRI